METSDSGLPQELMSSEGDGEAVSRTTTLLLTTALTPDQLAVTAATDCEAQQATIQAILQAAGTSTSSVSLVSKCWKTPGPWSIWVHVELVLLDLLLNKNGSRTSLCQDELEQVVRVSK